MRITLLLLVLAAGCSEKGKGRGGSGSGSSGRETATADGGDFREYVEKNGGANAPLIGKTFTYKGVVRFETPHFDHTDVEVFYDEYSSHTLRFTDPKRSPGFREGERVTFKVRFFDTGPATWSKERKEQYIRTARSREEEESYRNAIERGYPMPIGEVLSWQRQ